VFSHASSNCPQKVSVKSVSNSNAKRKEVVQNQNIDNGKEDKEEFIEVRSRKNGANNKTQMAKDKTPMKIPEKDTKDSPDVKNDIGSSSGKEYSTKPTKKWSVHKDILEAKKRSANKFTVFKMYDDNERHKLREIKNIEVVDEFLRKNVTPTESDMEIGILIWLHTISRKRKC
ncbi:hypothetical protein Tco_0197274, partial [Tanacetum coccineum]